MTRSTVTSPNAAAVGPYSHGVWAGDLLFLSGQTPQGPDGKLVEGSIQDQTRQCLSNLAAVLGAGGLTFDHVVKVNVFLVDMADFAAMNEVYRATFAAPYPARSTVGVAALPMGARVEIELVARRA